MSYACKIHADSLSRHENRLISLEVTFPRIILDEFYAHCMLSRNSAYRQEQPVAQNIKSALARPFISTGFGASPPGAPAGGSPDAEDSQAAEDTWLRGRNRAVVTALELLFGTGCVSPTSPLRDEATRLLAQPVDQRALNAHGQIIGRVLEPYLWQTIIVTATQWANFLALRCSENAQPEIRTIAVMMRAAIDQSTPTPLSPGQWHLPFVAVDEIDDLRATGLDPVLVSAGRCARVSYLTDDRRRDPEQDVALTDHLRHIGHLSPFEHQGRSMTDDEWGRHSFSGKLRGFVQYRKLIPHESDFSQTLLTP